jgi:hypothetical protein
MKHPRDVELVHGMLAAESPQRTAERIMEMLDGGEVDGVRELVREREQHVVDAIAFEFESIEDD